MSRRDPEKSVLVLDRMLQLLDGGAHWTRGVYDDGEGNFCLVGAMNQIRDDLRIRGAGTAYYLLRAIGGGRLLRCERSALDAGDRLQDRGGVDTFVRVIETSDFEPRLREFDDRLKALDAARATGAGSICDHNRRV